MATATQKHRSSLNLTKYDANHDYVTHFNSTHNKSVPWFVEDPMVPWPARNLLEKYSRIPPEDVEKVVLDFRNRAWEDFPYPCIGSFEFLEFELSTRRIYHRLLTRLISEDTTFLDIGCCLGHDIRKLIFDGVSPENIAGVELRKGYINLGFDLFRDRDTPAGKIFHQGDVLDPATCKPWCSLLGRFDIVNLGLIVHVFNWEEQITLFEKAIDCLENGKLGTMIIGCMAGTVDGTVENWMGKKVPAHNVDSFKELIQVVEGKTGTRWRVEAEQDSHMSHFEAKYRWVGPKVRRLVWEMTRIG
ncbi:methyltransferase [Naviculisporaceae sp. PSN 640]